MKYMPQIPVGPAHTFGELRLNVLFVLMDCCSCLGQLHSSWIAKAALQSACRIAVQSLYPELDDC